MSVVTCREVREALLPLYPDDLDGAEAARVRGHVSECASCAGTLALYALDRARVAEARAARAVPAGLLDGLADEVLRRAREPREPEAVEPPRTLELRPRLRLVSAGLVGAAAAAALVLATTGLLAPARQGDPSPVARRSRPPQLGESYGNTGVPSAAAVPASGGELAEARRSRAEARRAALKGILQELERRFAEPEDAQVVPAGGGTGARRLPRIPYVEDATIPRAPGREFRQGEAEPERKGAGTPRSPRTVSF